METKPRKTFIIDKEREIVPYRDRYSNSDGAIHTVDFLRRAPNAKARLATTIIERSALFTADDGGEDSTGRAKMMRADPAVVVGQAVSIADLAIDAFEAKGWYYDLPAYAEYEAALAEQKAEELS